MLRNIPPSFSILTSRTPNFAESRVISDDASEVIDKSHRDSQTTYLDFPDDPAGNDAHAVIKCIEERASHFQGNTPVENIENLQAVKYQAGGRFNPHYDWLYEATGGFGLDTSGNRESSFFVYLEANCTGGSTNFPAVDRPVEREWCETLNCVDEGGKQVKTVEVKPKVGRAIFWWNVDAWGDVDEMTLHAGAPVVEGSKIGLNIWTRRRRFR
jgi:prolyl 4-hydroxylase